MLTFTISSSCYHRLGCRPKAVILFLSSNLLTSPEVWLNFHSSLNTESLGLCCILDRVAFALLYQTWTVHHEVLLLIWNSADKSMHFIIKYRPSDRPVVSAAARDPLIQTARTQTKSIDSKHDIKYLLFRSADAQLGFLKMWQPCLRSIADKIPKH